MPYSARKFCSALALLPLVLCLVATTTSAENDRDKIQKFADKVTSKYEKRRAQGLVKAKEKNFPIKKKLGKDKLIEFQYFDNNKPVYFIADNLNAAKTVATDKLWPTGILGLSLDGSGETLGIWDGGSVRASHQEFNGRVDDVDSVALSNHATHVAGTMIAAGTDPGAKGMAFAANLRSRDWNNDTGEMAADQLIMPPVSVSNHSYGFVTGWIDDIFGDGRWAWFGDVAQSTVEDGGFGYYSETAADWDQMVVDSPDYLIVISAGNDRIDDGPGSGSHWHYNSAVGDFELSTDFHPGDGNITGYDTIGAGGGSAKNVFTVAAVSDIPGGYNNSSDVIMSSFSGWGPTDDGRIKPDLSANGIGLLSSLATGNTAYGSYSGTSMSAPNVAGTLGLLTQHARTLYGTPLRASTVKALTINTADEAGTSSGPDYKFGWGLLNGAAAAQLIKNDSLAPGAGILSEILLNDLATQVVEVESDGSMSLRATMAWTDPAAALPPAIVDPSNLLLVNDLDMRVIGPNSATYEPWIMDPANPDNAAITGDNFRDNIEQVYIAAPVAGTYRIEISHKGTLSGGNPQWVSLVVSGIADAPVLTAPEITSIAATTAIVGTPYNYDADSTVAASGSTPITFSLLSGPAGMNVSAAGLVSWTPAAGQEGDHPVEIQAENSVDTDTQSFTIAVAPPATGLDFNNYSLASYGGSAQDKTGPVTIEDGGATLHIIGNRWKQIVFPYTVTPDTVLEFDFSSSSQGEIHGIGLDTDLALSPERTFALYGTQKWGLQNFRTFPGSGGVQHYVIPVGQFYTGAMQYLFFAMDHDVANPNGQSRFSNVQVYDQAPTPTAPEITSIAATTAIVGTPYNYDADSTVAASGSTPITFSLLSGPAGMNVSAAGLVSWTPAAGQEGDHPVEIQAENSVDTDTQSFTIAVAPPATGLDFNNYSLASYGGSAQDKTGPVTIEDGGATLHIIGNRWKQIVFPYTVTADTVLEFDFSSSSQGEIHGIGLDTDLALSPERTFALYGTQKWGLQNFRTFPGSGGVQHYVIPVGQFYTGAMQYLFFAMDHDVANPNGQSRFSNVQVYDQAPTPTAPEITSIAATTAIVGTPYNYDADSTVAASGSTPITFSLLSGPAGMNVSAAGLVSWTPAAGQEGDHPVEIQAENSVDTDTQSFTIAVAPPATGLDFNNYSLASYGGSAQDKTGPVTIEDGGATLHIIGNRWKQIVFPYTVTPDTVLEFDFSSSSQGEIHGIGLDTDLALSPERTFALYGTQTWGLQNFRTYPGSGVQHYVIPVGQFYTGAMQYLFFAMDHDVSSPSGESRFSNVQVYED